MRMTSSCQNCGLAKSHGEFSAHYCTACFAAIAGAEAKATVEGGDTLTARREALAARAHIAHRNFTDPRVIDRHAIWLNANKPPERHAES